MRGASIKPWLGLRQCEAGGLDHDVIRTVGTVKQFGHRRDEVIGHSAADAPIVELDHILIAACLDTAAFEQTAIDAQITKFIDDQCDALAIGILEQVADHRRLARTEEAGDDRCRNLLIKHLLTLHVLIPSF